MVDERTEQLINRKLDGELAEGELFELQKALIRSPEARSLLEEYEAMELLASEALRGALARNAMENQREASRAASRVVGAAASRRCLQLRPVLAAAAVIALVVAGSLEFATRRHDSELGIERNGPEPLVRASAPATGSLATWDVPRREREQINGNVLGVYDERTKSYYLLELEQRDTTVTPVSMNY